jgi:hypothetical protein
MLNENKNVTKIRKRKYGELQKDIDLKEECLTSMKEIDKNSDGYVENTKVLFRRMGQWEIELNKDLYNFTQSEIEDLLFEMKIATKGDVNRIGSSLKKYLLLARSKKLGNMSLDIVNFFSDANLEKFVWKNKRSGRVINKKQLDDIVKNTINPRDKLFTRMSWMGSFSKNFKEFIELRKKDIDFENKTITTNTKIFENVPDEIMFLIEETIDENEYYSISINKDKERSERVNPLIQNDYIFRPVDSRRNQHDYMTADAFRRLGCALKKWYIEDYPEISMYNIYRSGMLWKFKKYLKENNIILGEDKPERQIFLDFKNVLYPEFPESSYKSFLQDYKEYVENNEEYPID